MKHKKIVQKKKGGISVAKAAAIGAGVAAVGAGAYYFLGPKGKQHRGKAKAWMTEMGREVEKRLQKAKSVTEPLYQDAVDALSAVYRKRYKGQASEVSAFAKKLKSEWKGTRKKSRKS